MKFRVFPVTITCDGRRIEETTVLILNMNGRSIAGLKVNKHSSMRDGRIELALIRQTKEPNFARRMGAYASLVSLMLMGGKGRSGHILRLKGSHFLIETDGDVVWDLDGEKGMRGDLRVDVLPGHMKLFVPRKKKI